MPEKTYEISDEIAGPERRAVLLLEDQRELADTLKAGLEAEGFTVTAVTNGADGIQEVLKHDFDIVLCDMIMPGFPGDKFYQAVERSRPHLCRRFIFMTGHMGDPQIDKFIRSVRGMMLWKPFDLYQLLAAVRTVLKKSKSDQP